ncbi:MAG: class I SAM-dependent rRNA methyltransferase [Desulfomonilia bacterium]
MTSVILKPGREESLFRGHPWIFSGAISSAPHDLENGQTVDVLTKDRKWVARGAFSLHSQIRVRIWTFRKTEEISAQFFHARLERAIQARSFLMSRGDLTAYRLVNAESDGLPGLIVDAYSGYVVCQFLSAGVELWKSEIIDRLAALLRPKGIFERSDGEVRLKEGLEQHTGLLSGDHPPEHVEIMEHGMKFLVDIRTGHKTGFYLDQRENHVMVPEYSRGAEVMNCFSYTGGFGLWALKGGASRVTSVDTSSQAMELILRNAELNSFTHDALDLVKDDAFRVLRKFRDSNRRFDLVIIDPPKFVSSSRQLAGGSRGYKDINILALKLLKPGGHLFTFSCSGHVSPSLFQKIVADAAVDASRNVQIIRYLSQSSDHPVALHFPEGHYLKGLLCRVW